MEEYENLEFLKLAKKVEAFVETLKDIATPKQCAFVLSVVAAKTIFRSLEIHSSRSDYVSKFFESWGILMKGIEIGKKQGLSDVKTALDDLISILDREEEEDE